MALTFYNASGSPYGWRVWLALEHKGLPYELKMLSFDKGDLKTPEFRALNPRGRVPVIVDDGFPLFESAAIVEYLEDKQPRGTSPFLCGRARTGHPAPDGARGRPVFRRGSGAAGRGRAIHAAGTTLTRNR